MTRRGAFVGAALALAAQDHPVDGGLHDSIEVREIAFEGKRDRHRLDDLDGDGRVDLVVITSQNATLTALLPWMAGVLPPLSTPIEQRRVEIFWNGPNGFDETARVTYVVPDEARAFAIADVLAAPGKELCLLDGEGVLALTPQPAQRGLHGPASFRRIGHAPSFFDYPERDSLPEWGLVQRGKEPASDALIVPVPTGFRVLRPGDGGLRGAEDLRLLTNVETESSTNRAFSVMKSLPRPLLRDLDGDGNLDFFVVDPSGAPQIAAYMGLPGGGFSTRISTRAAPSLKRELKDDLLTFETAEAVDLNGDGVVDLVVSRTEGNIGLWDTLTTSQILYYGRKGSAGFDTTPDQVVTSAGVSILPRAIDFDGDGDLDLLVSSYRTDLLSNVKNAVLNSARVTYFIFLMEKGRYPQQPNVERNIDLEFKVLEKGGVVARAYFEGDYDGDGVKDLLAVEEQQRVRAYKGSITKGSLLTRPSYEFAAEPMMEIALEAPNDLQIADLDGTRRSAILFPESHRIRIVTYRP